MVKEEFRSRGRAIGEITSFSSLQDLRTCIQQLFEQLTFEQVMSISSYNFILEALFYAASY